MNVLIASPLYPPEIGEPAPYVKELGRRLSHEHRVTILAYAHLPEQIPNVRIITVSKYLPLPVRLIVYTARFLIESVRTDIVFAENGASIELPLGVVSLLTFKKTILHIGDSEAETRRLKSFILKSIRKFATLRVYTIVTERPAIRPEILPFEEVPSTALKNYEASWKEHVTKLNSLFNHA